MLLHVWPHISPPFHMLRCFVCYQCLCLIAQVWQRFMTKLGSWGVHMWGCVGRDLTVVPYWRSLYLYVEFFPVASELCVLSSCWGWGRLLLNLFLVCLLSNLPGAPAVFCFVSSSWRPFWGSTPHCLRLADLVLRWGFRVGLGVSCYRYPVTPLWFSTLCQRSSPYAASPSGFCALAGCVGMSDSSLLVYSWGCAGRVCAVPLGFSPMCRALPQGLQRALLSLMQVHWGFSGHRVSVLLLPW